MTKFNYVNDEKKPLKANTIYRTISFNKGSVSLPIKLPGVNHFSKRDAGLFHKTKNFRDKAYNIYENTFVDRNYSGGNDGKGFHKHNRPAEYKYNFNKTKPPKESKLTEEELALEQQRYEGGDVRGYARLDIKRAKQLMKLRNKPRNEGDNHSKGMFGAGMRKYKRMEEIDRVNNNKETYLEKENEEFGDLFEGIKKEKLEYTKDYKEFNNATDGI